jgi:hypothetical protein
MPGKEGCMRKIIILGISLALFLPACSGTSGCQDVPASFFRDIDAHGQVVKSGAVKSIAQTSNGRAVYEVAARFSDGSVAVWSTGGSIIGGGPTFPMNDAARQHSDQGVDAPSTALPDDADGVANAQVCVQEEGK